MNSSRIRLVCLRVVGEGKSAAEVSFGRSLTFITGDSNTGKSHILECLDFAMGAGTEPRALPERRGYEAVELELEVDGELTTIRREFNKDEFVEWRSGGADSPGLANSTRLKTRADRSDPIGTISGRLLAAGGYDPSLPVLKNQKGETRALSFRLVAPLVMVSETAVIRRASPAVPDQYTERTAAESVFRMMLSNESLSQTELDRIREAHAEKQSATQTIGVLGPMIESWRAQTDELTLDEAQLRAEVLAIDEEFANISESRVRSDDRLVAAINDRNAALDLMAESERLAAEGRAQGARFELLAQHLRADVERLQFVVEGGNFFQQIRASHCPTCGRPIGNDEECHQDDSDFSATERAARAEIHRISPKLADLDDALKDVASKVSDAEESAKNARERAASLEADVSNLVEMGPDAERLHIKELAARRRLAEDGLLVYKELARFTALKQDSEIIEKSASEIVRPKYEAADLRGFQREVSDLLNVWKFPDASDVVFSPKDGDLTINGKRRSDNGKGVLAVTHAAFTVGLQQHCLRTGFPHPGFVVIDSPLNPYKGEVEEAPGNRITPTVAAACLRALASGDQLGQTIVIDNVDPPSDLDPDAIVHRFGASESRKGFYGG
jgi:hypothetical protein